MLNEQESQMHALLRIRHQILLSSCYLMASKWLARIHLDTVRFPFSRKNRFCSSIHSINLRKLPCVLKINASAFLYNQESLQNSKYEPSKGLCQKLCEGRDKALFPFASHDNNTNILPFCLIFDCGWGTFVFYSPCPKSLLPSLNSSREK